MVWEQAFGLLMNEVAVDFGSGWLRIYVRGRGLVVEEPSILTVEERKGRDKILAMGAEARRMMGRTPHGINTVLPFTDGRITHPRLASRMLSTYIDTALGGRPMLRPRMVVSIPHEIRGEARRDFLQLIRSVGGRDAFLVDSLICAGMGCGLPIHEANASMIIDIGQSRTRAAIMSLSGFLHSETIPIGGAQLDQAVIQWLQDRHYVSISPLMGEELKIAVGCASSPDPERGSHFNCRDSRGGIPRDIYVTSEEVYTALQPCLSDIRGFILEMLEQATPEMASDILDKGILLCGGGSRLTGIDQMLQAALCVPVIVADDPGNIVVRGAGSLLEDPHYLQWLHEEATSN
jgi:rod shape-determining protein MreB and related proteins